MKGIEENGGVGEYISLGIDIQNNRNIKDSPVGVG